MVTLTPAQMEEKALMAAS